MHWENQILDLRARRRWFAESRSCREKKNVAPAESEPFLWCTYRSPERLFRTAPSRWTQPTLKTSTVASSTSFVIFSKNRNSSLMDSGISHSMETSSGRLVKRYDNQPNVNPPNDSRSRRDLTYLIFGYICQSWLPYLLEGHLNVSVNILIFKVYSSFGELTFGWLS